MFSRSHLKEDKRALAKNKGVPEQQFSKGMKVKLISGGPVMAVNDFAHNGQVNCVWFSGKKLEQGRSARVNDLETHAHGI
jgi:uncharacterized protein YodC (DUF2158 family)